jgi:RNA polymerase sigma-70 factor (ECF subfamily)
MWRIGIFLSRQTFTAINFYTHYTDLQLWEQIRANNNACFDQLYQRTVVGLTNQAYKILQDVDLTRDTIQDVFLKMYLKRNELPANLNITGYLHTAVKHKSLNLLRDQLIRQKHHAIILEQSISQEKSQPTDVYETTELKKMVQNSIQKLPHKCREAFMLNYYGNLPYKAIAEQLDISVKTVEKYISKAFRILRQELGSEHYLVLTVLMGVM